jgi:hypothetical protein
MTRILLALLALLGFAAQSAHAEAGLRAMGGAQVRAVQTVGAREGAVRVVAKRCEPPMMRQTERGADCIPLASLQAAWTAPTVRPRIDRARE